jgi:tRNA(Ile)-lysidine synthase TilS/MesJ
VLAVLAPAPRRAVRAREAQGFTKIALGHHRDDLVATFFLNLFFHAKLGGMPPKLLSDDGRARGDPPAGLRQRGRHRAYAERHAFPIIPCNLCGSQENLQRKQVKKMMEAWEKRRPGRIENDRARARRSSTAATERPEAVRSSWTGARGGACRLACLARRRTARA